MAVQRFHSGLGGAHLPAHLPCALVVGVGRLGTLFAEVTEAPKLPRHRRDVLNKEVHFRWERATEVLPEERSP